MLNSALIEILRTLDKNELKRLEDFVVSPYFNKKSNVTKLFKYIKKFSPEFKDKKLIRETAWAEIYPGKTFNYGVMKNLIFDLNKIAEKFIELQNYSEREFDQAINIMDQLTTRNLKSQLEKKIRQYKEKARKSKIDLNYFYYIYLMELKEQNYLYAYNQTKDVNYCNTELVNENMISYFFSLFFSDNYNAFHEGAFYNKSNNDKYLSSLLDFFKKSPAGKNEIVKIYHNILKTQIDRNDEGNYEELKKLIIKNIDLLSQKTKYNFFLVLINFCIMQAITGKSRYIKEQLSLYKFMLEKGFYNDGNDNYINPYMYANVVSMAGNLKEFDWAEKFINEFKDKLHPSNKDQCYPFAYVALNLKKKEFSKALEYLSKVKSGNVIDKITIRKYQLMLYYESGFFEELFSLLDTSKHFISNDTKMSSIAKNIFNNFLTLIQKLSEIKFTGSNKKFDGLDFRNLKKEINEKEVSNKIWLLEKLEELVSATK